MVDMASQVSEDGDPLRSIRWFLEMEKYTWVGVYRFMDYRQFRNYVMAEETTWEPSCPIEF